MHDRSVGERVFGICNAAFMVLLSATIVLPFLHLLGQSLSSPDEAMRAGLHFVPRQVSLEAYAKVLRSEFIGLGYMNTLIRTVFGTAISLLLTAVGGYVLSKRYFPHRTFWTALIVFTMFFSGGLIPGYLLVRSLGLIDRYLALILPGAVGAFNLIIMRNYFMTVPESLEESARIDGTSDLRILFSIVMPLSKPMLVTVGLWIAVGHWNAWFDCMIYIRSANKYVLQVILQKIILEGSNQMVDFNLGEDQRSASPESIKAASIYVATLPIMLVYPFIQRYFVQGVLIGALKG